MAVLLLLLVVSKNLDLRTAKPESAGSWERMARKQIPEVQSLYWCFLFRARYFARDEFFCNRASRVTVARTHSHAQTTKCTFSTSINKRCVPAAVSQMIIAWCRQKSRFTLFLCAKNDKIITYIRAIILSKVTRTNETKSNTVVIFIYYYPQRYHHGANYTTQWHYHPGSSMEEEEKRSWSVDSVHHTPSRTCDVLRGTEEREYEPYSTRWYDPWWYHRDRFPDDVVEWSR